jgi:anaerobic magnesium-protoporphyrin IX monomethyl ester cyclase
MISAVDPHRPYQLLYAPLGLGYIAAYVRQHMPSVEMKIVDSDVDRALQQFGPDIVGITSVSQNFGLATGIGERCKALGIPVFIGGVHISALPHSLPSSIDFGVIGEGEQTVLEVLRLFNRKGLDREELQQIRGLVLRDGSGQPFTTGVRELIEPPDTLPFPARDLLVGPTHHYTYLVSSRGCPYKCAFCFSTRFWREVRFFSPAYVVRELEEVSSLYRPAVISFWDDLFIADRSRLEQIADMVDARQLNRRTEFHINARADLITPEVVTLLKRMNVATVTMGLESGCQRTLTYLKGRGTVEQNARAIELLKARGIRVSATFIIGSPQEDEEEILETLDFIRNSKLDTFIPCVLTPYPGTPVWEYALERGLVSKEKMDWAALDLRWDSKGQERIVLSEKVSGQRLQELSDLFERESRQRRVKYAISRGLRDPAFVVRNVVRVWREWIVGRKTRHLWPFR